jgi:phospholipase/carboxylesterase
LLVLLHGYGANAADLLPVARALSREVADVEMLLPEGALASPGGRAWWSVADMNPGNRGARIAAAGDTLNRWLDHAIASRGLSGDRLFLLGFSQGAALATHLGTHRALGGVIALCGRGAEPGDGAVQTPFLLVNGARDEFITPEAAQAQAEHLRSRGASVRLHLHPHLGHGIDALALAETRFFLASIPGPS